MRNVHLAIFAISLIVLPFNDCESAAVPDDGNCKQVIVTGDTYYACTGIYSLIDQRTPSAPNYPVYQKVNATSVLCGSKGKFLEFAASCEECSQDASVCGGGRPYGGPADCKWTNQKCIFDESKGEDQPFSCKFIYFHPDIPGADFPAFAAKGWRITSDPDNKLLRCTNPSPDCGDYLYRSSIEKQKFWLDKDTAWTQRNPFEAKLPDAELAKVKVECLET